MPLLKRKRITVHVVTRYNPYYDVGKAYDTDWIYRTLKEADKKAVKFMENTGIGDTDNGFDIDIYSTRKTTMYEDSYERYLKETEDENV